MWYLYFLLHKVQKTIRIWFTPYSLTSPKRWALRSNLRAGTAIQFWVTQLSTAVRTISTAPYCHLNLLRKSSRGQVIFSDNCSHLPVLMIFSGEERSLTLIQLCETHLVQVVNERRMSLLKFLTQFTVPLRKEIVAHLKSICTYPSLG